ncbi:MAG: hypothetical protein V3V23_02535, partial [Dehalococcoidales bacterium]
MKSFNLHIHRIITEAVETIGCRQSLRRVAALPLYRNALYLMLNTVIMSLLGFFFWMVVARFYSMIEVGYSSAIISAIRLLALLSLVGLNFSVIRFLPQADRPKELINSSFTLSALISLVIAAIFIAGLNFWSPRLSFIGQNAIFALTFLVVAVLFTLSNLMGAVFIARRGAGFVLSKNAILSLLRIPLLVVLATLFHTFGVIASWGIAIAIALTISVFLFLPRVEDGYKPAPALELSHISDIWRYSGSSYLASLLSMAPTMILPLMVLNVLGTQGNAYFYIAWMIASLLFAIPRSVSRSLFAEGSYSEENIKENVTRSIKLTFMLLVPAVIVMMVAAKWVLIAFGWTYSVNALKLLWLLTLSSLPLGISQIYFGLLRVQYRLKELVIIQGFIAIAVLTLSFFIMPTHGIIGIGYVWLGIQ